MPTTATAILQRQVFQAEDISLLHCRISPLSACGFWALPDAPGRDIRRAQGPAACLRLAAINAAGEAVDQPHVLIGRRFEPDISESPRAISNVRKITSRPLNLP